MGQHITTTKTSLCGTMKKKKYIGTVVRLWRQSMQKNGTNLFFHMEHKRMLMSKATEIKHLCWAVDIEVPKKVYDLL